MRHDTALIPRNILRPLYATRHVANLCSRNNITVCSRDISYVACKSYNDQYLSIIRFLLLRWVQTCEERLTFRPYKIMQNC